jgi:alkanesulfonate monooxygenase SsuD/methylene tetrahydromethanopterin reductase-like flavin-dependent oxidoreductase (luciferase family)
VEYIANVMRADINTADFAKAAEAAGWDGVAITDHTVHGDRLWPHVWVAAAAAAVATERIVITTAFVNNLFRSPIEFAQASIAMQVASGGRFEAGLGAGWAEQELLDAGMDYPPPGERVGRYIEALTICRRLFETGSCSLQGTWYQVDVKGFVADGVTPPPLTGALGGPRMLREASPLLDRIEVKAAGVATRGGALDFAKLGQVSVDNVRRKVEQARRANPDAPLSFFGLCSAAPGSEQMAAGFADDSVYKPFFGEPGQVVEAFESLADLGFDRVTVSPVDPAQFEAIATARASL